MTERVFFAASPDSEGSIHQVNMFRRQASHSAGGVIEAIGGAGVGDIVRVGDEDPKALKKRLIAVGYAQPIFLMAKIPHCIHFQATNNNTLYFLHNVPPAGGDIDRRHSYLRHPFAPAAPHNIDIQR